jgi:predicted transcriptional regulator
MTKEQEIYKNMKMNHRIWKSHGKYGINFENLYCAIRDAGYDDYNTICTIIDRMVDKGYIRMSRSIGRAKNTGKYIIEKWVN